jgi:GNAT superfamily N-acetyltransferase
LKIERVHAERIIDLRHRVLRAGLPIESARFEGDDEPGTIHLAAIDQTDRVVGCASLVRRPWLDQPAWQLRGMAVESELRRSGVGLALLQEIERHARLAGHADQLWCNARLVALDFYKRAGWSIASDLFDIPTAGPHHRMTKRL